MGRTRLLNLLLIVGSVFGCGGPDSATLDSSGAPGVFELARATYTGILNSPVTLVDGQWEGDPFVEDGASRLSVGLVDHFILTGDLDGDGVDEAAALLRESSGGSGTRLYLSVMGRRNGDIENLGTALVGDRVQIRSGEIDDGKIILNLVRTGPEDAACCPTEKALVTWTLGEDGLSEIADETAGTLSLADLGGHEWVLHELGRGQPPPEDIEISMVFQDDRVSGSSGCNSYFAGVTAPKPGDLRFNGMGATRMACPEPVMDVERRYLQTLAGAKGYAFLAGQLSVLCETEEGPVTLIYTPSPH